MKLHGYLLTSACLLISAEAFSQDNDLPESMTPIELSEEQTVVTAQDGLEERRRSLFSTGNLDVTYAVDIQGYASVYGDAGFGTGVTDLFGGETFADTGEHVTAFLRPGLIAEYDLEGQGEFYSGLSIVAVGTGGEPDYGGFTGGNEASIDLEDYYVGWRSESGRWDISAGGQNYQIGSGFVIADGNFDRGSDGAYKTSPRYSFRNTAIGRFKEGALTVEGFYLRGDEDWDNAETVGVNADYASQKYGTLGGFYAEVTDSNNIFFDRDGMELWNVRYTTPKVGPLTLEGEYVDESGGTSDRDAEAFFVQGKVEMELPFAPRAIYRYAEHSGDDPTTPENESFDSLYYGFTGWQSWFQGDIVGSTFLFNSNQKTHLVGIGASPMKNVNVDLNYLNFTLDKPFFRGAPTDGTDFADELNLIVQVTPAKNWYIAGVVGVARANDAAEGFFGDDDSMKVFDLFVAYTF